MLYLYFVILKHIGAVSPEKHVACMSFRAKTHNYVLETWKEGKGKGKVHP
jgi:hypothetical protein